MAKETKDFVLVKAQIELVHRDKTTIFLGHVHVLDSWCRISLLMRHHLLGSPLRCSTTITPLVEHILRHFEAIISALDLSLLLGIYGVFLAENPSLYTLIN